MKATFDQHIGIFEDAVPKEWCNDLIRFIIILIKILKLVDKF
jgi:hypothetical protein